MALTLNQKVNYRNGGARDFTAVAATDICNLAGHGFVTGQAVVLATSSATPPAGLSVGTVYYVINVDANTFKLAASQANAVAGTAIDITTAGTGTHSIMIQTATFSEKCKIALKEHAANIFNGNLSLATINGGLGSFNATQSQVNEWASRVLDNPDSTLNRMLDSILSDDVNNVHNIYANDTEIRNVTQNLIKSYSNNL